MPYKYLLIEKTAPHIKTICLNRPDNLNALNRDIMEEIVAASYALHEDGECRVVIFRGMGKHFSAGADVKEMKTRGEGEESYLMIRRRAGLGAKVIRAILDIPQITIAAVHGVALGGAACMVNACDFRIGSEECQIGYPEIDRGMNLMWQALPLCVQLIGPAKAKRMIIGGIKECATDLEKWGFLDQIVDRESLLDAALEMANLYAAKPPIAAQMIKASVNAVSGALNQSIMHMDTDQNLLTAKTADRREAMQAFFDKRDATFSGN